MSIQLSITNLAHGGYGVGRIDGQVWFVPYGLPGDVLQVVEERRARGVVWGKIEGIDQASPHRGDAPCPVFKACGGCTWLHFAYPAQGEWKVKIVAETLRRVGGVDIEVGWLDDPEYRMHYRTRAEFHGDGTKRGFYGLGSHSVVDLALCALCHPRLNAALAALREAPVAGPVEITVNPEGDDVLVWTADPNNSLLSVFPQAQSFRQSDERAQFLFDGAPVVNGCFSQSSLPLNRILRTHVHQTVGESRRVLDLYCGSGNLSLGLDAEVLGLDHNRASVRAAVAMQRGEYRVGQERDFCDAIRQGEWDVIILDPPRAGAKAITPALAKATAGTIVYVSCDVATLARDVKSMAGAGWRVDSVTAVDMFPHTAHAEAVCILRR